MNDAFITAVNTTKVSMDWIDQIVHNMSNLYTPGYKEIVGDFQSCLNGVAIEDKRIKLWQGSSFPGSSPQNIYFEGQGFFLTKKPDGEILYTRNGSFTFDGEGLYKTKEGYTVQGYILNDKGEIMGTPVSQRKDPNTNTSIEGGPASMATTDIKLWIDPSNGKYLGKYEEYQFEEDGTIYGKADKGKIKVPLFKVAINNFNNASGLTNLLNGYYMESDSSGKPVMGRGEIRSGLIETSNTNLKNNIVFYQQAKMQVEVSQKLISNTKQLLEESLRLLQ